MTHPGSSPNTRRLLTMLTLLMSFGLQLAPAEVVESLAPIHTLIEANRLTEARAELNRFLKDHPTAADARFLLGYVLFRLGAARDSLAAYTEAAKYRHPTSNELKIVASDYVLLEDYPDADRWFTQVVAWAPADVEGWYYLGRTKYNENRFEEALAAFTHALRLDPRHVKAEDNLGLTLAALGRNDEAMAAYHAAIDWQRDLLVKNTDPMINLGELLTNLNRAEEALPLLRDAAQLAPDEYRAQYQLGRAYLALSQLEAAQRALEQAVALSPRTASLHYVLAQLYRREGRTEQARAELARYSDLNRGGRASR